MTELESHHLATPKKNASRPGLSIHTKSDKYLVGLWGTGQSV